MLLSWPPKSPEHAPEAATDLLSVYDRSLMQLASHLVGAAALPSNAEASLQALSRTAFLSHNKAYDEQTGDLRFDHAHVLEHLLSGLELVEYLDNTFAFDEQVPGAKVQPSAFRDLEDTVAHYLMETQQVLQRILAIVDEDDVRAARKEGVFRRIYRRLSSLTSSARASQDNIPVFKVEKYREGEETSGKGAPVQDVRLGTEEEAGAEVVAEGDKSGKPVITVEDVAEWLKQNDLGEHAPAFIARKVTGPQLLCECSSGFGLQTCTIPTHTPPSLFVVLGHRDLVDLGVKKAAVIRHFAMCVQALDNGAGVRGSLSSLA
jgi:hypothetical protein